MEVLMFFSLAIFASVWSEVAFLWRPDRWLLPHMRVSADGVQMLVQE